MRQLTAWEKWPEIRRGIERVIKKTGDASFIPEDVYASIVAGNSFLFEIGTGFAVVQLNRSVRGPMLFVWILYMPPGNKKAEVIEALDGLAKSQGCVVIRFHSPRAGWEGFVRGEFEPTATVYERKIK